jgi:hypothetical protein
MRNRQGKLALKVFKAKVIKKDVSALEAGLFRHNQEIAFD